MSVSDPLLKELKGYTARFLQTSQDHLNINDNDANLLSFCACLENIFNNGIISTPNSFGFIRQIDAWTWIEKLTHIIKEESSTYQFISAIDGIKQCKSVFTNRGRLRLLIRYLLKRKSLHMPVHYLAANGLNLKYYDKNSIVGDEILCEILLSVLYHCGKMSFNLDLGNTSFLDLTWIIPEMVRVELVPTSALGMSISFAGDKAIIVKIGSNSVCAESMKISVGDVLDSLNGVQICSATRGRLSSILRYQKGLPINLTIIKAISSDSKHYAPLVKLYKQIDLDVDLVKANYVCGDTNAPPPPSIEKAKKPSPGYKVHYVGNVEVGRSGDVAMIDKAFQVLYNSNPVYKLYKSEKHRIDVQFEVGELGVKCVDAKTNTVLVKHSFMEISSCGSVVLMPQYFAYIAGEEYCNVAKCFVCYLFMTDDEEVAYTILQGIGQGFHRTHYAV